MSMVLNNGFCEMTENEMMELEGGGWLSAIGAFLGGIFVGGTPVACALGGPGAGSVTFGLGCLLLDKACDNVD